MTAILLTALLSSAITLISAYVLVIHYWIPKLEEDLEEKINNANARLAKNIEQSVRQGVMDGVSSLLSKEVIQGTTRTIAKTGVDFVGEGFSTLLGVKKGKGKKKD